MEQRIKFTIDIPKDIISIKDIFKNNGYKLYVVGGAVRDALLGKTPKDFDLATDAVPDKVEEMMKIAGLNTLPTGKAFGVINVFTSEGEYEIATFREDIGTGRRPDGVSFTNIEGDVKRRDLTINALFYDIDTFEIVDLVGGIEDLKNGVVRTVGSAKDRISDDPLRIQRAVRFSEMEGRTMDKELYDFLLNNANLDGVSAERIRDEFIKGLKSSASTKHFLITNQNFKLFNWIFKGLIVNENFINDRDVIIVLTDLLKENNTDLLSKALNNLKYSVEEIKAIKFLISLIKISIDTIVLLKKAQEHAGVTIEQIKSFGKIQNLDEKLINAFLKFNLSVTGPEAMELSGLSPSKELGQFIEKMEIDNFKKLL